MARGKGKGGYRAPFKPAGVSGPGALSARTDGAVPQMLPSGGDYGDRKALATQQAGAPMSPQGGESTGAGVAPAGAQGAAGPPSYGPQGVFGPTARPGEPLTAGVDWGAGPGAPPKALPDDAYIAAKALYSISPTPELERLIARLSRA